MTGNNIHLSLSKNSLKNIPSITKRVISSAFWGLGKNAFTFIVLFMLLGVVLGEFLFYKYVFLVQIQEPIVVDNSVKFHEDVYTAVMQEWQVRQENSNN